MVKNYRSIGVVRLRTKRTFREVGGLVEVLQSASTFPVVLGSLVEGLQTAISLRVAPIVGFVDTFRVHVVMLASWKDCRTPKRAMSQTNSVMACRS
jgi:hypothetical protein